MRNAIKQSQTTPLFSKKRITSRFALTTIITVLLGVFSLFQIVDLPNKTIFAQTTPQSAKLPLSQIRSTTYYPFPHKFGDADNYVVDDFKASLPGIKANGFNTVWFVTGSHMFQPTLFDPTSTKSGETAYTQLLQVLEFLKQNNMQAIVSTTYTKKPADMCQVLFDPVKYQEFVTFNATFLSKIQQYSDITDIEVFTEGTWPCLSRKEDPQNPGHPIGDVVPTLDIYRNAENPSDPNIGKNIIDYTTNPDGTKTPVFGIRADYIGADAPLLTLLIKPTLGRLPLDLPADIRAKFRIGFHDANIANHWVKSINDSPLGDVAAYDFLNFGMYYNPKFTYEPVTNEEVKVAEQKSIQNIRDWYPTMPIFRAEMGAANCYLKPSGIDPNSPILIKNPEVNLNETRQAEVLKFMTTNMINQNIGINIWEWEPNYRDTEPESCANSLFSLTYGDRSLRPAAVQLKQLLSPLPTPTSTPLVIQNAGVALDFNPWVVWATGQKINDHNVPFTVKLSYQGSTFATLVDIARSSFISFTLPSNLGPNNCNLNIATCVIGIQLFENTSSNPSNIYNLTLPSFTFQKQDVGSPLPAPGSVSYNNKQVTLKSTGKDIYYLNDSFTYAYTTLTGDGELKARVLSYGGAGIGTYAKAGIMMRESLNANSKNATLVIQEGKKISLTTRTTTGGTSDWNNVIKTYSSLPVYLKLVRKGNLFSGYSSTDGANWTLVTSVTVPMSTSTIYTGLVATSNNTTASYNTALFDTLGIK